MERKAEYCLTQIFHYLVNGLAAIVFFCCIAYSGYALWDNWSILKEPDQVREDLIRYKPANEEELSYSFQELKAMNPDVCGWLTLDHTKIDYPVVQGTDNFEYLEKDVLGNPSVAGSIFLDAKSDRNFHDFYTVIMGHHMQGRKMFGDIDLYTDASFFEKNTTGTLYVEGRILKLETVAILKADAYDKYVYRTDWKEKEEKEELQEAGCSLGTGDRAMQKANLDRYEARLVQRIAELQKGLPERKRLCQSLGIMGGLFLFLILV